MRRRAALAATVVARGVVTVIKISASSWAAVYHRGAGRGHVQKRECHGRHLDAGGRFVIELWVPPLRRLRPGQVAVPFEVSDGHLGFDTYDLVTQRCTSHHYWPEENGTARYGAGHFRYIWPAECDLMAQLAGNAAGRAAARLGWQPIHLRQRKPRLCLA